MFIKRQKEELGTNHIYNADPFNEMTPTTKDLSYLHNVGKSIFQSMIAEDPDAIWIMQGWFLVVDDFWQPPQAKALLNSVPKDRLLMLDLWAEVAPIWPSTGSFYNHSFVWTMLHDFGGRSGLYGKIYDVNDGIADAVEKASPYMSGIGLTPEAIEQNPIMYDFVMDMTWRDGKRVDVDQWVVDYTHRRYGQLNSDVTRAWKLLQDSIYNNKNDQMGPSSSIIVARPAFNITNISYSPLRFYFDTGKVLEAWRYLVAASDKFTDSQTYQYDMIDVTAQSLSIIALDLYDQIEKAYNTSNLDSFMKLVPRFLDVIQDMEEITASNENFLVGKWTSSARSWARNNAELVQYESNARMQITSWTTPDVTKNLNQYANKLWSGLTIDFYLPRWTLFFEFATSSLKQQKPFDLKKYHEKVIDLENKWVFGNNKYTTTPQGTTLTIAKKLYNKYQ
jgi:alpha-N-acetylglucosaminidase